MEKTERNLKIVEMRKSGMSIKQIASEYGLDRTTIRAICKRYGVGGKMCKQYNQYTNGKFDRESNARRYVDEKNPTFEYVGNYTGIDGYADIRCKQCGAVMRKSFVSIRHGTATCDVCQKMARDTKVQRTRAERKEREWQKERAKWAKLNCEQTTMVTCRMCGGLFVPFGGRTVYCSNECRTRATNTRRKDKRIRKLNDVMIDKDITLKRLYLRDGGKCYICGQICDWNDYTVRDDGTIITNNNYPSIEHVIPLSKGGKHAWSNVKLACRGCNSKKKDKYPARLAYMPSMGVTDGRGADLSNSTVV